MSNQGTSVSSNTGASYNPVASDASAQDAAKKIVDEAAKLPPDVQALLAKMFTASANTQNVRSTRKESAPSEHDVAIKKLLANFKYVANGDGKIDATGTVFQAKINDLAAQAAAPDASAEVKAASQAVDEAVTYFGSHQQEYDALCDTHYMITPDSLKAAMQQKADPSESSATTVATGNQSDTTGTSTITDQGTADTTLPTRDQALALMSKHFAKLANPATKWIDPLSLNAVLDGTSAAYKAASPADQTEMRSVASYFKDPAQFDGIDIASDALTGVAPKADSAISIADVGAAQGKTLSIKQAATILHDNFALAADPANGLIDDASLKAVSDGTSAALQKADANVRVQVQAAAAYVQATKGVKETLDTAGAKKGRDGIIGRSDLAALDGSGFTAESAAKTLKELFPLIGNKNGFVTDRSISDALKDPSSALQKAPADVREKASGLCRYFVDHGDEYKAIATGSGTTDGTITATGLDKYISSKDPVAVAAAQAAAAQPAAVAGDQPVSHKQALQTFLDNWDQLANSDKTTVTIDTLRTAAAGTKDFSSDPAKNIEIRKAANYFLDHKVEFLNLDFAQARAGYRNGHDDPSDWTNTQLSMDGAFQKGDVDFELALASDNTTDGAAYTAAGAVTALKESYPYLVGSGSDNVVTWTTLSQAAAGTLYHDEAATPEQRDKAIKVAKYYMSHQEEWRSIENSHGNDHSAKDGGWLRGFDLITRKNEIIGDDDNPDDIANLDDIAFEEGALTNPNFTFQDTRFNKN